MEQPIWGNKFITYCSRQGRNILYFQNWIKSGIRLLGDLVFNDKGIDTENNFILQTVKVRSKTFEGGAKGPKR